MNYYYSFILFFLSIALIACNDKPTIPHTHLLTLKQETLSTPLFYSGIVQPLKTVVVTSPADGVIVEMPFQYGEFIRADQLLFMISSTKFLTDYKAALMQYIKAKSDFNNQQTQLSEATFLHKNELISDDDFKMKQSNYYAAQLTLLQAKDALDSLMHQLSIKNINLNTLTIADINKITKAMHLQANAEDLRILSPANGVLLSANKNAEENKKTNKGDAVKLGDVLALIGDMSGLTVRIKVNELTVNQLKVGQKVKITGIAFADDVLIGNIKHIEKQGELSNGGLPVFSAEIVVPQLTQAQQQRIHVGMSAKVEIDIKEEAHIAIPITAVKEKNGYSVVNIYDERQKKLTEKIVKTGKTTAEAVIILAGLKEGDRIAIPD